MKKIKEIIIINLTRMGDLLQTTPLMEGFKVKHPDVRITLLVNSTFTEICKGIPHIDDLIVFDMHGFRERNFKDQYSLVENYIFLKKLMDRINMKEYDLLINLTHSPVSALITSLINAREVRGFSVDSEGHRIIKHPWLRYFFNVGTNRDFNPFHLVDMYLKAGNVMPVKKGLMFEVSEEDRKSAEDLLVKEGIIKGEMLFGVHLGASKSDKTWPVASFAVLADRISSEYNAKIILFGSPSEADLGLRFENVSKCRPINFIGRTSIGELSALLQKCTMLISNDTGPLHLATAVGTKVIDIFTANVHFMETAPYGDGHYVIQADLPCVPCGFDVKCSNMKCKDVIMPEKVFEVTKEIMYGRSAVSSDDSLSYKDIQVFRTHFREDGLLSFYPVIKKPVTKEILYRILYRDLWNMNKTKSEDNAKVRHICPELTSLYDLESFHDMVLPLSKDVKSLEHLRGLAEKGLEIVIRISEEACKEDMSINKLKEMSAELGAVDDEIEIIGHANPCFRPLTVVFAFSREAMEGSGLVELAEDSRRIYSELLFRSSSLAHLLKQVILFIQSGSYKNSNYEPGKMEEVVCKGN